MNKIEWQNKFEHSNEITSLLFFFLIRGQRYSLRSFNFSTETTWSLRMFFIHFNSICLKNQFWKIAFCVPYFDCHCNKSLFASYFQSTMPSLCLSPILNFCCSHTHLSFHSRNPIPSFPRVFFWISYDDNGTSKQKIDQLIFVQSMFNQHAISWILKWAAILIIFCHFNMWKKNIHFALTCSALIGRHFMGTIIIIVCFYLSV